MPSIKASSGSGMTTRGILTYDWTSPDDVGALIKAAVETLDRSSFARLDKRITKEARAILQAAGLPFAPDLAYVVKPDGTWVVMDGTVDLAGLPGLALVALDQAVLLCGHAPDSAEGYAVQVLMLLQTARFQLRTGSLDEAMATAFAVGECVNEAAMKGMFDPDFALATKVREGGRRGHADAHGTEEEKAARKERHIAAFDAAFKPGMGRMAAYESAARQFGVSVTTIRRAVRQRDRQA